MILRLGVLLPVCCFLFEKDGEKRGVWKGDFENDFDGK